MRKFTDSQGDDWNVQVTLATAKRLRADGRDLLDVHRVNEMLGDPISLFDLLFLVCEPQARKRGIDDEQFGERLAGCGEKATEALIEELQDFFQQVGRPAMAALLNRVWTSTHTEQARAVDLVNGEKATKAIETSVANAMRKAEIELDRLGGETSTESPEL